MTERIGETHAAGAFGGTPPVYEEFRIPQDIRVSTNALLD